MHTILLGEFDLYMNILGPQFVNRNQDLDSITFWKNIQHRVPALASIAKACVYRVLYSANAKRSNSTYNIVFDERGYPASQKLLRLHAAIPLTVLYWATV